MCQQAGWCIQGKRVIPSNLFTCTMFGSSNFNLTSIPQLIVVLVRSSKGRRQELLKLKTLNCVGLVHQMQVQSIHLLGIKRKEKKYFIKYITHRKDYRIWIMACIQYQTRNLKKEPDHCRDKHEHRCKFMVSVSSIQ